MTTKEKVTYTLPKELVETVRDMAPPRGNSKFVAEAIAHYIAVKRRQSLREELIAGYQAFAEENQKLAETWTPLGAEAWETYAPYEGEASHEPADS